MSEPRWVDIEEVRDMRTQILREMHEGFKGVYSRQDKTNGRIDVLQERSGEHEGRIIGLERETETSHQHRRATDPQPQPVAPKVDAEDKPVRRWDVVLVLGAVSGAVAVWKFITYVVTQMKP